jgi:hypothetical protein
MTSCLDSFDAPSGFKIQDSVRENGREYRLNQSKLARIYLEPTAGELEVLPYGHSFSFLSVYMGDTTCLEVAKRPGPSPSDVLLRSTSLLRPHHSNSLLQLTQTLSPRLSPPSRQPPAGSLTIPRLSPEDAQDSSSTSHSSFYYGPPVLFSRPCPICRCVGTTRSNRSAPALSVMRLRQPQSYPRCPL